MNDPRVLGGVSGAVRETGGNAVLLLVAATCYYTHTENIKHFQQRIANRYTVRMHSGWVVATRHSSQNLAHAYLQHSWQESSPGMATVLKTVNLTLRRSC
jgi:hypothetical protein